MFNDINFYNSSPQVTINEIECTLDFFLCADYKVCNYIMITDFYNKYDYVQCLLTMIGMKGTNCSYDCLWCTIAKDARYACLISVSNYYYVINL